MDSSFGDTRRMGPRLGPRDSLSVAVRVQRASMTTTMCVPPSSAGLAARGDLPGEEPLPHRRVVADPALARFVVPDREEVGGRDHNDVARMSLQHCPQLRPRVEMHRPKAGVVAGQVAGVDDVLHLLEAVRFEWAAGVVRRGVRYAVAARRRSRLVDVSVLGSMIPDASGLPSTSGARTIAHPSTVPNGRMIDS